MVCYRLCSPNGPLCVRADAMGWGRAGVVDHGPSKEGRFFLVFVDVLFCAGRP